MSAELQFNSGRDVQGYFLDAPAFPEIAYSVTLTASTHEEVTVPGNASTALSPSVFTNWIVVIKTTINGSENVDVWAANGATAAVPAGATIAATTSILVSSTTEKKLKVRSGDVLSFITAATGVSVSLAFYAVYF